jgi:hypothetical protein
MLGFGSHKKSALLLILVTLTLSSACSEKITSPAEQGSAVSIRLSVGALGGTTQASRFILTVTGPGIMEPLVSELAYADGFLTGRVVVPAGPKRLFRIEALDQAGVLIYAGQTVTDVKSGSEFELTIALHPEVPMIKVTPSYVETMQGDLLAMTVEVYNLPDVSEIQINLVDYRLVGNTYIGPTTVVVNSQIAKVAGYSIWTEEDYSTSISFALRDIQSNLVDENGYAELATFYYQTQGYKVSPVETATFTPTVTTMADKAGVSVSVASVRSEGAEALLYDYRARLIGLWDMGYDYYFGVADNSGNELNGTAYGTTLITGKVGQARSFNGTSDYVEIPDNDLLDERDKMSISMWVSVDGYGLNPYASLICKRNANGPINYQLLLEDPSSTDGYMSFLFRYGSSVYHTYRVDIPDSWRTVGWFHVLFYYRFGEPSSATLVLGQGCYIDEMPGEWIAGNGRAGAPTTSGPLLMGKDNASTTNYFAGGLDEVELFDIVWTPGLVQYYLFTGCR